MAAPTAHHAERPKKCRPGRDRTACCLTGQIRV